MFRKRALSPKNFFRIIYLFILGLSLNWFPALAESQSSVFSRNIKDTADDLVNNVLTSAGTLLMTAAFVLFFYGVVVFILGRVTNKGDMKDLEKGKEFMLWGLIALFVMVSAWGIIRLAQGIFDIQGNSIEIQPVQFAQLPDGESDNGGTTGTKPPEDPFKSTTPPPNPIQTGSSGKQSENIFANTTYYPVLRENSKESISIKGLTTKLQQKYCLNFVSDIFDSKVKTAVINFQKINGLNVDGVVGKDTWEALYTSTGQKTYFTDLMIKNCNETVNID